MGCIDNAFRVDYAGVGAMNAQSRWSRHTPLIRKVTVFFICVAFVFSCVYLFVAFSNQRGGSPTNIAVAPDGTVYVSDHGLYATMFNIAGSCIWVIDSRNDRVAGLIKIDHSVGDGIGVAPNGKVYVFSTYWADQAPTEVVIFDPHTSRVSQIIVPGSGFTAISFAQDGRVLLEGARVLHVIDPTTDQYAGTIPSVPPWFGEAMAPDGQRVYDRYYSGSFPAYQFGVRVIDIQTDTMIRDIPLPTLVVNIVPLPDGRFYALCNGPDGAYYVTVVDPQTGTILKTIPLDQEPHGYELSSSARRMVLAPNGKVYIVRGKDFVYGGKPPGEERGIGVYVVDPATDAVVNFIPLEPPLGDRLFPFSSVEQAVAYLEQLWAIVASSVFRAR